jgi:uncharacterized SAM-binding protein YcdF (DUF218 family)
LERGGIRKRRRSVLGEIGRWFMALSLFLAIAAPLLVLSVAIAVVWQARTDEARPVEAIVVLGAAQYNGRPSNVLQARLDHALTLFESGTAPLIVVTGGRAPGDAFTEAEASRDFLLSAGVPEAAILMEEVGRDTWQSLRGVERVLADSGIERILIVSDGFHLLRGKLMARELGFTAYGSAAPESPIEPWSAEEMGYVVRETAGILAYLPKML